MDEAPIRRWYRRLKKQMPAILRWIGRGIAAFFGITLLLILLMRWIDPVTSSFMVQRSIAAFWNEEDGFEIHQSWTDYSRMSPYIKLAAITSEDQAFAHHWGIDFGSIRKALKEYNRGEDLRGASTITQQTAKNLFLWPAQSYIRKGIEAYLALALELLWPKERILEVYLNIAEFGNGVYGVEVAARRYFNTTPANLSKAQSALMVTALPAPRRYNLAHPSSYMIQRRNWVMRYMSLLGGTSYLEQL